MVQPVNQGVLNRLRASVVFADFPELNITSEYTTKGGVQMSFQGDASQNLPTMTGVVGSPEPYQLVTVTIHAVRSQALSDAYKQQFAANTQMGSVNVVTDSVQLSDYQLESCVLLSVDPLSFDGNQPEFTVRLSGVWYVNSELWAAS